MTEKMNAFILHAIDPDLLYPCLAVRFETTDLETLRRFLSVDESEDSQVERQYVLAPLETANLCAAFDIAFDHHNREVILFRDVRRKPSIPYLIHGGYELALMVHGRKPFAFMDYDSSSKQLRTLKARFDHYVSQGILHAHPEIFESKDQPGRQTGTILYTTKGEEWRIPAYELVRMRSKRTANGFENVDRLTGALLGYEEWQNDWWIDNVSTRESFMYGASFRCAVSRSQYDWLVHAGFRALPPFVDQNLTIYFSSELDDEAITIAMRNDPGVEAIIQFHLGLRHLTHAADFRKSGPYEIPASLIPTINLNLSRPVRILVRRDACIV
jgi:hypothetical protein